MRKRQFLTKLRQLFTIVSILVFATVSSVGAQEGLTPDDLQNLYRPFFDPESSLNCSTPNDGDTGSNTPGTIYIIGDSLTHGMKTSGSLGERLTSYGWNPVEINAVPGEDLRWGKAQLESATDVLAGSQNILIGLGTNNVADVAKNDNSGLVEGGRETVRALMQDIVNVVKSANPSIKIYWTSVYMTGTLSTRYGTFNMDLAMPEINGALDDIVAANSDMDIDIVPWGTSKEAKELTSSDGLHPSGNYQEMAGFVVNSVRGVNPAPLTVNGCACTGYAVKMSRNDRYRATWNYFTTQKKLSESATAGIMGNLEAESGIDPNNTQDTAPLPDSPEFPIEPGVNPPVPDSRIRGKFGYGIAQWTSEGRQQNLLNYASETGRSTGDLGLQLDFLWKELTESYTGVTATLQDPDVTLDEASYVFLSEFEIPLPFTDRGTQAQRDAETANRQRKAQAIFNEFSGQAIGDVSVGTGCSATGVSIDMDNPDTSDIPCPSGTDDGGATLGYRQGLQRRIRICRVNGGYVNSQLAESVRKLFEDSNSQGVPLEFGPNGGSFRSMDGQIAIYYDHCRKGGNTPTPGPYPKRSRSEYTKCPGGAPPGYSNHQMGLALDLSCNGKLIPQSYSEAQNNPCFQWLVNNAVRYGLYELGKGENRTNKGYEGWHWSVDGG